MRMESQETKDEIGNSLFNQMRILRKGKMEEDGVCIHFETIFGVSMARNVFLLSNRLKPLIVKVLPGNKLDNSENYSFLSTEGCAAAADNGCQTPQRSC